MGWDTVFSRFKPQQKSLETLRTLLCYFSKDKNLTVRLRVSTPQELRKKLIVSRQTGFAHIVILCLRLWAASIFTVHVRKHDLLEVKKISNKKRDISQMRKQYIKEKRYNVLEMWECEWWNLYKTTTCVEDFWENHFLTNVHWEKRDYWNKQAAVNCLVMYDVTLNCLKTSGRFLLFSHPFSKLRT